MTTWRYLASRALTDEWLHTDLPLDRDSLSWDLSGPGSLSGTIAPEIGSLIAADGLPVLAEWATYLWAEADGVLRWGGILVASSFTGSEWKLEAAGFSTYPKGVVYTGSYRQAQVSPMVAAEHIWDHLQAQPDGDLQLEVDTDPCPLLLGKLATKDVTEYFIDGNWTTSTKDVIKPASALLARSMSASDTILVLNKVDQFGQMPIPSTVKVGSEQMRVTARSSLKLTVTRGYGSTTATTHAKSVKVTFAGTPSRVVSGDKAEPYELQWYEAPDCGDELDSITDESPLDYTEHVVWDSDEDTGDDVARRTIRYHYPRAGRRRSDLSFSDEANIAEVVTVERRGDTYANTVLGLGKGEGTKTVRADAAVRDGRLRRCSVLTDKAAGRSSALQTKVRAEVERLKLRPAVAEVTVRDHPHAPIGSWELGDDILLDVEVPWLGRQRLWHRIIGWSLESDSTAKLRLAPSESFAYGPPAPAPKAKWELHATLTPADRTIINQGLAADGTTLYTAQDDEGDGLRLVVTRWVGETATGTMELLNAGHGDLLGDADPTTADGTLRLKTAGGWRSFTFTPGATVDATSLPLTADPAPADLPVKTPWLQGETYSGATTYRLYGSAWIKGGPRYPKKRVVQARVQVIEGGKVLRKLEADWLGRDKQGVPIDGKIEPEGLTVATIGGVAYLLAGISTGTKGKYRVQVWRYPLEQV